MTSGRYFNKRVKALDSLHVGHVVRETDDTIIVFGAGDDRYDIPKSQIRFTSGNVLIDLPIYDVAKRYKVSREEPLPTGEQMDKLAEEDYMTLPPLPPLARHPSDMREWRSLAYYNCAICNRVGADYIINVPEEPLPIPICGSCYFRTLNNNIVKKTQLS